MGLYERMLLAPLIDAVCALPLVARNRGRIVPLAEGVVLEPGIGSGHNIAHYDPDRVRRVIGVDPSRELLERARARASEAPFGVELLARAAESLPLESGSVDTVLLTYTGCSIAGLEQALGEFRRVLKPSGRLLFCEHGRSSEPRVARLQDILNPLWRRLAGGCNLNRDIARLLGEAGFVIENCERFYAIQRPKFLSYHYLGTARRR